jgi:hypothetical protein
MTRQTKPLKERCISENFYSLDQTGMEKSPSKKLNNPPATNPESQIGRETIDGKITDTRFLQVQMGFTPEEEAARLANIQTNEATLALEQIEAFCKSDPSLVKTAFQQLLKLYPNDARAPAWKERIEKAE